MSGKKRASAAKKRRTKRDNSSEEEDDSEDSFVVDDSEEEESDDDFDSDDDDRDPGGTKRKSSKPWLPAGKPRCQYGAGCRRKNPVHFKDESHPPDHPLVPKSSSGGSDKDADVWLPSGKPRCKYGMDCRRQNPTHFAEESHPSKHGSPHIPKLPRSAPRADSSTSKDDKGKDDTGKDDKGKAKGQAEERKSDKGSGKADQEKADKTKDAKSWEPKDADAGSSHPKELKKDDAVGKKRVADNDQHEVLSGASKVAKSEIRDDVKGAARKEVAESGKEEKKNADEVEFSSPAKVAGLVRAKAKAGGEETGAEATAGEKTSDGDTVTRELTAEPKVSPATAVAVSGGAGEGAGGSVGGKEETRRCDRNAKEVMAAQAAMPVVSLGVVDLDDAADRGWQGISGQTMALPLLCADEFLACDEKIATRAAMTALGEFLRKYDSEEELRILLVEPRGSAAFAALTEHCTVDDKRLKVAVGGGPKALGRLGSLGVQCGFVVVEADPFFARGKRPSRGRTRVLYDASGPESSAGYLGKAAASKYRSTGVREIGKAYAVEVPPSSPLNSVQGCQTVIQAVVPSMNAAHENAILDPERAFDKLLACYRSTLDIFYVLRKRA